MGDTIERRAAYGQKAERLAKYPNVLTRTRSYGQAIERVAGFFADTGFATYFEQVQDTLGAANIVAHYKLDETSGTNAADSSGNGNDGTYINGPTLGATSLLTQGGGTAVDFDGVNDHVEVGQSIYDFIPQTGVFTVVCWVELASDGSVDYFLSSGVATFRPGVSLRVTGTTLDAFFIAGGVQHLTSTTLPADGVHQIAFTGDGTTATLYVDGTSVDTVAITPNAPDTLSAVMHLGERSNSTSYFPGKMDEVTFADVHATSADVTELYNYGTA